MTESDAGTQPDPAAGAPAPGYSAPQGYGPTQGYGLAPQGYGPIGTVRGTGIAILLFFVTFGIYSWVWFFKVHDEMKRHRGSGLGGGIALVLAIFVGFVMPYVTSSEVGELYESRGQAKPVSGLTGLWYFPGMLILVGPFIWFVKTNHALNAYWRSAGAA